MNSKEAEIFGIVALTLVFIFVILGPIIFYKSLQHDKKNYRLVEVN